jgi:hypothetical protein
MVLKYGEFPNVCPLSQPTGATTRANKKNKKRDFEMFVSTEMLIDEKERL